MSVSVRVRPAVDDDAATIARVHVDSWRGAYRGLLPDRILDGLSVAGREGLWRQRIAPASRGPRTLVAEVGGSVEGFVTFAVRARDVEEPPGVGEIPALYVSPSTWRSGVGTALLAAALDGLRAAGCREAILWMLDGNRRAARFYRSRGWADDGGRRRSQYFPDETGLVEARLRRPVGG